MSIYLNDIPLEEAQARLQEALEAANLWQCLGTEMIPLDEQALGRVLAEPIWANLSSPHYHASAMDGFALRSVETEGANLNQPLVLTHGSQTIYLDTGDPLPAWADAVIPIEDVEPIDANGRPSADPRHPDRIRIRSAVAPWKNVRTMGEDVVASELMLPSGHILRPVDLGAIAACGHDAIPVACKPRVAVLPSGSELVPIGQPVEAGDIIEYNSIVLAAQIRDWGGEPTRFPITPDEFELLCEVVAGAVSDHDLILLNAGSSAGSADYSARVVQKMGDLLVHGVAVRPGHPVIIGMANREDGRRVPIFGVPGYPVSAALTGEIFIEPLIARWLGRKAGSPLTMSASLTRKVVSPAGDDDYVRVAVGRVGGRTLAAPLTRGAGVITSLVRADGIVIMPRGSQGMPAGSEVEVRLYRPPLDIERTVFAVGSHDLTLDLLAQFLADHGRRLASANVGSLAGLIALRRREAHLAGSHLLDPDTGDYNLAYIREYLRGVPVKVLGWVGRQQGLLVVKGNPKNIRSIEDLTRSGVRFINRQRGAGTRVLLDYHMDLLGIAPGEIDGYNDEVYNHLAVAAAVASGRADCGLGIEAAARSLGLAFLPLFQERYDLVVPAEHFDSEHVEPVLQVAKQPEFAQAINKLPGYDTSRLGELIAELE